LRQTHGRIIFTSSGAATGYYSTWGAYGSSKAALNHLCSTLAVEEPDITTISIRPGTVDTDMQGEVRRHHKVMDPKDAEKFKTLYEQGGLLSPEQPGNVMARLVVGAEKGLSGKFLKWVNLWKRKEMWLMDHSWNGKELEKYQD
jgi:NAD(P)-dependent dehydrogenase (short-subunit alcohol dehydrogenase family)